MDREETRPQLRTLQLIWLAFMGAAVIYAVIGGMLARQAAPGELAGPVVAAFAVAAMASAAAGFALPPRMLARVRGHDLSLGEVIPRYQSAMVVGWACFEAVALLGLVLTLLTGEVLPVLSGAAVSVALLLAGRPRPQAFLQSARLHRARP